MQLATDISRSLSNVTTREVHSPVMTMAYIGNAPPLGGEARGKSCAPSRDGAAELGTDHELEVIDELVSTNEGVVVVTASVGTEVVD